MIPESNEIRVEITTKCNYKCIFCPRDELTRKQESMSFETFKYILDKIIAETKRYNTLSFPGMGEPMLNKELDEMIIYAKKHGFSVLMLTNASLLTVERFKRFEEIGVDSIRISLYGDTDKSYMSVHGINNMELFQKIKNNLTEIASIRTKTRILLSFNVVKENDSVMNSWIEYWKEKVDLLEVWRPHNWVDTKQNRIVQKKKLRTCGRPFYTPLQIQVDGTVNMCCFDFNGKLSLGDLKTQKLNEIFDSPMFRKILQCHQTGIFTGSGLICENCDQRNIDKSDVMVYNSKFDIRDRINKVSTTYMDMVK